MSHATGTSETLAVFTVALPAVYKGRDEPSAAVRSHTPLPSTGRHFAYTAGILTLSLSLPAVLESRSVGIGVCGDRGSVLTCLRRDSPVLPLSSSASFLLSSLEYAWRLLRPVRTASSVATATARSGPRCTGKAATASCVGPAFTGCNFARIFAAEVCRASRCPVCM